jgi:uncharacterized protein YdgA (DUF945 family)
VKKLLAIAFAAFLLAAVALPYVFGIQTERLYLDAVQGYAQTGRWQVLRNDFDRGWFRSVAHTDLEVGDLRVETIHVIDHGPLPLSLLQGAPWTWRPAQAAIGTEALLVPSGGKPGLPLQATTRVALNGNAVTQAGIAAGDRELPSGDRLSWQPVRGEIHLQPASSSFRGQARVPGLVLRRLETAVTAEDCDISFNQRTASTGVPLGVTETDCRVVRVSTPDQPPLTAERLTLASRGDEDPEGLRYELGMDFERLSLGGTPHGPGSWSLVVDRLDAASVSRLQVAGTTADLGLADLVGAVATRQAELVSTLEVAGGQGQVEARVGMRLDESADPGNPFSLITALNGEADLRAPVTLVRQAVAVALGRQLGAPGAAKDATAAQRREAMLASQVEQQIRQWQDARYLVEEQDHYRLSLNYRKGVLLVNGQLTDWLSALR